MHVQHQRRIFDDLPVLLTKKFIHVNPLHYGTFPPTELTREGT